MPMLIVARPERIVPSSMVTKMEREASSAWRTTIAWVVLCVLAPLLLLGATGSGVALNTSETWLTVLLTVYSGTHLAVRFGRGELRIGSAAFWLFVYVAMSVASLAPLSTGLHSYLA